MKKLLGCLLITASVIFTGCSKTEDYESSKIVSSYKKAVDDGYSGSLDDWVGLTNTYQQNPQQAQQIAASQGYDGSDMLLAGVAGAVAGHMLTKSSSGHPSGYSNSYNSSRPSKTVVNNYYQTKTTQPATTNTSTKTNLTGATGSRSDLQAKKSFGSSLSLNKPRPSSKSFSTSSRSSFKSSSSSRRR